MSLGGMLGAAAIQAGGSLLGGAISSVINDKNAEQDWKRNYEAQKEFAQNSIQWRVQDAQKAGIHPLYAMGNTVGYTPSSFGAGDTIGQGIAQAGNAIGEAMGQIQLMNLASDLKNKQLQNTEKELDIYNRLLEKNQNQQSATIPHVTQRDDINAYIVPTGNGKNRGVLPDQLESELISIFPDLRRVSNTLFNREANNLPYDSKKYDALIPLGFTGYEQKLYPKGTKLPFIDRVMDAIGDGRFNDALKIIAGSASKSVSDFWKKQSKERRWR